LEKNIMTRRKLSDVLRQEVTKDSGEDAIQAEVVETPAVTATRTRKTTDTPATEDQSAQVQELKAALMHGAEQEKEFQSQIKSLESDVKQKQKQIESLELQTAQVAQLKTELAEAKEVILQLSAANTQMSSSLDQVKKQPLAQKSRTLMPLNSIPHHSIQHGTTQSSKPKSVDVGWMD
jgi:predicted RNase H-like nuclease (RuvC/YqgF family)